jgi:hypothetical protein
MGVELVHQILNELLDIRDLMFLNTILNYGSITWSYIKIYVFMCY